MAVKPISISQVTVTTAGTAKPLSATSLAAVSITVSAVSGNTGSVFIGDSTVSATRGHELVKGTSAVFSYEAGAVMDLKDFYVDAATSGDKVNVIYLSKV